MAECSTLPPRPSLLFRTPLWIRVIVALALGSLLGVVFGDRPILWGVSTDHLGQIGLLPVKLLRALAIPLIFFAILDGFVKTNIPLRRGAKLLLICLINVSVAMAIGLIIMNVLKPGRHWRGNLDALVEKVHGNQAEAQQKIAESHKGTLGVIANVSSYVPKSIVEPFFENNVITVVLLALFTGAAYRRVHERPAARAVGEFVETFYAIFVQMLEWVVEIIPFAVLLVVSQVVGKSGLGVFKYLWLFLCIMLLGMAVHSLIYYPLVAWLIGRKPPREYIGKGADAILTSLSCNSSLATVPVTLRGLERMGVSAQSARLSACVGTQLNNDGITLYEAMAALFLAQAIGMDLPISKQMIIVVSSIMAGAGIAGIPEAGLIVLPLVLGAAGFPDQVIAAALPLIIPVDWILARVRSAVNVMSDMLVAILLDVGERPEERVEAEVDQEGREAALVRE
ncbi:MAG TPA: dicarboxylate/amino acid:cation symporter [Tepidisphaeraceae bacterium]|jgi:Na+/H+-dicarboxylate symporter|nr:dicarboxylate/amino acid:cation symporter [Tepidisphaeraceae bacterium]